MGGVIQDGVQLPTHLPRRKPPSVQSGSAPAGLHPGLFSPLASLVLGNQGEEEGVSPTPLLDLFDVELEVLDVTPAPPT